MTDDQNELLAVLDVRLHDLMSLCEEQKRTIEALKQKINADAATIQQAEQKIQVLNAKYMELLTAHIVSFEAGDVKNARMRLSKLVREVEKCIALLNG
jgi:septal ring factor EnvC (AmiA/AmiB activator)